MADDDSGIDMDALKKALELLTHVGHIAVAQGAMGWMYRGDLDKARETLQELDAEVLTEVALAASVLGTLAEELAAEKTAGGEHDA